MSDFSQILPDTTSTATTEHRKKPSWARLRGKILGVNASAEHTNRPRSHTEGAGPQHNDLVAFLAPSRPSTAGGPIPETDRFAPVRRQTAPTIEVTSASKWQNTVALATRAELDQQWADRQELPRYKKPPRRAGLRVGFVNVAPEVIGHGGDEAEEPAIECRRERRQSRAQQVTRPTTGSILEDTQRREGLLATQHTPSNSTGTSARPGTAYPPATPGPTLGDRIAIMTEAVSDFSVSGDQGYFPQMPTTLKQPGANAFAAMPDQHPALRERPKTAPSLPPPQQRWVDSPTLPPQPIFQAQPAQGVRPRSHTSGHSPPKPRSPHQPGSSLDQSALRRELPAANSVFPTSNSSFSTDSTGLLRPGSSHSPTRRRIPSPLALSFGPSDEFSHPIPEPNFRASTSSVSPQRKPMTASSGMRPQTPAKPVFGTTYQLSGIEVDPPQQPRSPTDLPTLVVSRDTPDDGGQRNFSQPYPIASKGFFHVRKPVGSRPTSSSSRPSSSQSQSGFDSRPSSQAGRDPQTSPTRPTSQQQHVLPLQPPPVAKIISDSKQTDQDSRNAALFVFVSRTKELAALIRSADLRVDPSSLSTAQWLRAAVWWLLGARTDIKELTFSTLSSQAYALSQTRAHLNVSKTWYIITELVAPRLASITASNAQGNAAYSAEIAGLFTLTDKVVDAVKVTCLDMMGKGAMPASNVSTREMGLWPKDVMMVVSDEAFPRRWEELGGLLGQ